MRVLIFTFKALEHLESFIADCDRKTELAKKRLKESQEELSEEANAKADSIHNLGEQIGTKLAKAEELGADGNVEESLKLMEEVEELKKAKTAAEVFTARFSVGMFHIPMRYRLITGTQSQLQDTSSRSCVCAMCARLTWAFTTMTASWPTTSEASFTWGSFRSATNWLN